jgi:signal peptidase I
VNDARAPEPPKKKRNWAVLLLPVGGAIVATALLAGRLLIAASYKNPSGSMLPTLTVGEHVLVNKLDKTPQRGKMIVFRLPEHPDQLFIKRIVGMPGDTIEMRGETLVANGKPVPACAVGDFTWHDEGEPEHKGRISLETLGDARYLVLHDAAMAGLVSSSGPWTVKAGEVFVLGDNRENSHDSRYWWGGMGGGVPLANIVGTVQGQAKATDVPPGTEALKPKLAECLSAP